MLMAAPVVVVADGNGASPRIPEGQRTVSGSMEIPVELYVYVCGEACIVMYQMPSQKEKAIH